MKGKKVDMGDLKLQNLVNDLIAKCLNVITTKNVDLYHLAFLLGISSNDFFEKFAVKKDDVSFYLETYNILSKWQVD